MNDLIDPSGAGAGTILVSNQAELNAALAAATGGESIKLSGGTYDSISLTGRTFGEHVTISSADPGDPAVFTGTFFFRNVSGLEIEGVDIIGAEALKPGAPRILVMGGEDISFSDMKVVGARWEPEPGVEHELAGWPQDYGVRINDSRNVTVSGMEFTTVNKAITFFGSEGVTIRSSEFHDIRSDGIGFSSSSNVLIEDNYFHDFYPFIKPAGAGDHPDFIQFMGDKSGIGLDGVTIRDNAFIQGEGYAVQAILGWSNIGLAPFTNFEISGNVIQNSHSAGIAVSDVIGARIHDNILIPAGHAVSGSETGWRPSIFVSWRANPEAPSDVVVEDNIVTLSWNPNFEPLALSEENNAFRGNLVGDVTVLDQGKVVPGYWADITLPDRSEFADHASWKQAVLAHLRESLPEDVAALLPALPEDLEIALEPKAVIGDVFVVKDGYHRLDQVDFTAGDSILFEEESAVIGSIDALLARAAASGAMLVDGADLRLVEVIASGERVLDIDLSGIAGSAALRANVDRDLVKIATGEAATLDFGAELTAGATAASDGLMAELESGALVLRDGSTEGAGHRLERIDYAVVDDAGRLGLGSVAVAVRDAQAVIWRGGEGDDRMASGHGDDALMGGAGDDNLFARRGDDWLDGGVGDDRLTGGGGSDMLIGGAGADIFVFYGADARNGEHDIIADLDFTEGDRLSFGHFEAGTFGDAYRWSTGDSAGIISVDGVIALDAEQNFSVARLGQGHAMISYMAADGGVAEIENLFAGDSAQAFDAAWLSA